jgi:hypothetical protein
MRTPIFLTSFSSCIRFSAVSRRFSRIFTVFVRFRSDYRGKVQIGVAAGAEFQCQWRQPGSANPWSPAQREPAWRIPMFARTHTQHAHTPPPSHTHTHLTLVNFVKTPLFSSPDRTKDLVFFFFSKTQVSQGIFFHLQSLTSPGWVGRTQCVTIRIFDRLVRSEKFETLMEN